MICSGDCGRSLRIKIPVVVPGDRLNRPFCSITCGAQTLRAEKQAKKVKS